MNSMTKKSDSILKTDVLEELRYDPSVKVTDIGVLVKDGTVTLNGYATSYGEKYYAIAAAKRVAGVQTIADEIEVKLPGSHERNDSDIAAAAAHQILWCTSLPADALQITLSKGNLTLEGTVEWGYQKKDAEEAVQFLAGVNSISNLIKIQPKLTPADIDKSIKAAFERSALVEAKKIKVETSGNRVTLTGKVHNHAERDEAVRVAWASPGVASVDNKIGIEWSWDSLLA